MRPLRPTLAVLAALLVASLASEATAGPSATRLAFRLLQFNVRFDFPGDVNAGNGWGDRVGRVVAAIRDSGASVVTLQEDKQNQVEDLKHALGGWEFAGKGRDGRSSERCSVAWDARQWRCAESGDFWLSDTPEVVNSNTWGTKYPHKVSWAELEARGDSKKRRVLVLSTHLDEHKDKDSVRTQSARVIRDWLVARAKGRNVVLGGDFNAAPSEAAHDVLTDAGLRDCWDVLRPADPSPGTVHDFTGRSTKRRIDWILVGGSVTPLDAKLHRFQAKDGKWPSDHYPVLAELEVGADAKARRREPLNASR